MSPDEIMAKVERLQTDAEAMDQRAAGATDDDARQDYADKADDYRTRATALQAEADDKSRKINDYDSQLSDLQRQRDDIDNQIDKLTRERDSV